MQIQTSKNSTLTLSPSMANMFALNEISLFMAMLCDEIERRGLDKTEDDHFKWVYSTNREIAHQIYETLDLEGYYGRF